MLLNESGARKLRRLAGAAGNSWGMRRSGLLRFGAVAVKLSVLAGDETVTAMDTGMLARKPVTLAWRLDVLPPTTFRATLETLRT